MTTIYTLPKLKSLRQGARIAFIRQYRQMTQKALGIKVGMTPVSVGRMMNKIEVHDRDISPDRLKKMAEVLDVNIHMIERWDFKDPEQLFYALLWIDELCPNIVVRNTLKGKLNNETMKVLNKRYAEWRDMSLYAGQGTQKRKHRTLILMRFLPRFTIRSIFQE